MSRVQTMVQLNDELLEILDARAAKDGVSRSELIRRAIEGFLAADREAEIDRQIVAGYTNAPQGGEYDEDEWGNLATFSTHLVRDMLRHLDEEEREAGFEPW